MADQEMFESSINKNRNLGGVFEQEDDTCYFYLCKITDGEPDGVLDTIHITSKKPSFNQSDVVVRWNRLDDKVGLLINGKIVAFFDIKSKVKHGENMTPIIPEILESFDL